MTRENVAAPDASLRALFELDVSAASGLVVADGVVTVVSDDALALHRVRLDGTRLPSLPLVPGADLRALPKRGKPDLEALLRLDDGRLLAFGSGSRPDRERGFVVDPASGEVLALDLSGLYAELRLRFGALNIEGAAWLRDRVILAHRADGRGARSGLAVLDAAACRRGNAPFFPPEALLRIVTLDLPALDGVPLSITDLAAHPGGGLYFLAAAEDTANAVDDGPCIGSVLGRFDDDFHAVVIARLRPDLKTEGLAWWRREGSDDAWLIVSDADDPERRSPLFELLLPAPSPQ